MILNLILLIVLLVLTAFFSGAETALFSLSRHELLQLQRDPRPAARLVPQLLRHPRRLLLTLMIGNVTINMFIYAASLSLFQSLTGDNLALAAVLGLLAPMTLTLLGDIVPKGAAIVLRRRMAGLTSRLIYFFHVLLGPVNRVLSGLIVEPLTRLLIGGRRPPAEVTVDELRELLKMSERRRIIDPDENAMLHGAVLLGELKVRDIMIPRVDMVAFDIDGDPEDLRELMRHHKLTKIPVYQGSIDHIRGLVYARDLYLEPSSSVADLVRPVHFVPEIITLTQLLAHFRRTRSELAAVVDEYGGVVGLVTIEDVARQIVGELAVPDSKAGEPLWQRLDDRHYRVSGRMNIRDWAEQFHIGACDERISTLAGLMLSCLGRVPAENDEVRLGNLRLTVDELHGKRIAWVRLELLPAVEQTPTGAQSADAPPPAGSAGSES